VEDIDAVIRQVGGPAFLFGHSSGAILALESGAQSAAVKGVALYEPPFIVDDTRTPLAKDFVSRLSAFLSADRRGDAIELFMTEAVGVPREMVAQMRAGPMWAEMEKLAPTISYDVQISADFQRGKPLPANRWVAVTAPTLVMDGGSSPAWARNAVQALANTLPNARRRTLDGQTHGFDPAVLAPVLVEFFSPESRPPRVSQDGRASAQGPGAPQA
jgi:pimeloyl-ACP methyl ester carboxylesterase